MVLKHFFNIIERTILKQILKQTFKNNIITYLNTLEHSVKTELLTHILDKINDGILTNENKDEWHFHCFNENYYIVYHSEAIKWLKNNNIDVSEAIEIVREYENDHFGEFTTKVNPESIVNMLAYILGEELIYSFDAEAIEELEEEINEII